MFKKENPPNLMMLIIVRRDFQWLWELAEKMIMRLELKGLLPAKILDLQEVATWTVFFSYGLNKSRDVH